MNEQITKIQDVDGLDEFKGWDGFVVTTTTQRITLLIDNSQDCCENWGHFWMNDKPEEFIGAELLGVEVVDTALDTRKMDDLSLDEGETMFVNLRTSVGVLQFTAYNSHNGYYGHTAEVKSEQMKYDTCL